jgi:polysaccharide biosynthesis/export protein
VPTEIEMTTWLFANALLLLAILPSVQPTAGQVSLQTPQSPGIGSQAAPGAGSQDRLTLQDQIAISVTDVEGLRDRLFRIEADGTIALPLVGKVRAEGLTVEQLEKELTVQFGLYVRSPKVSVAKLAAYTATFVAAGAFKNQGSYALPASRTLLDAIAGAGGLQPNVRTIRITRRLDGNRRALPSGLEDTAAGVSTATFNLNRLTQSADRDQLTVEPGDVLYAALAGSVFLTGEVLKPGAFELAERDSFGVTELIAMAGGLGREAAPERAAILRPILNGTRRGEIPVDVKSILDGRSSDFRMLANDMLVVPRAQGKGRVVKRALMYMIPPLVTTAIYVGLRR